MPNCIAARIAPVTTMISKIRSKISDTEYRISDHAVKRMIQKGIELNELEEAVLAGEIIEQYPKDKYSPSCLIYGKTHTGRDLHVQLSLPPKVVVITIYPPDPKNGLIVV
jgi:hypothetical protein